MIGNNLSDMKFGKAMGMHTVFLHTTQEKINLPHELIDEQFESLASWSATIK
jgi:D-glycero-D-manno-heptose 1,7-bisphosphate phosphatase